MILIFDKLRSIANEIIEDFDVPRKTLKVSNLSIAQKKEFETAF
jgi:hypothetical protein